MSFFSTEGGEESKGEHFYLSFASVTAERNQKQEVALTSAKAKRLIKLEPFYCIKTEVMVSEPAMALSLNRVTSSLLS